LVPTFIQHLFLKMFIGTAYRLKVVVGHILVDKIYIAPVVLLNFII